MIIGLSLYEYTLALNEFASHILSTRTRFVVWELVLAEQNSKAGLRVNSIRGKTYG